MDCEGAKRVSPPSRDSMEPRVSTGGGVQSIPVGCLLPEAHAYVSSGARCDVSVHQVGVVGVSRGA